MSGVQDLLMPKLGLTMTEGLLAEWKVTARQQVQQGDTLFVVETEKIANEVEAPADGVIEEILVPAGEVVPVGAVLARWNTDAAGASVEPVPSQAAPDGVSVRTAIPARNSEGAKQGRPGTRIVATPLARRLACETGIDLRSVTGTGPRGRVKAGDVLAAKEGARRGDDVSPLATPAAGRRERASNYETTVAKRLTAAKRDVPHFYVAAEADVGALLALRDELNSDEDRARITVTHMLLVAVARAVAETPEVNRSWRDGEFEHFSSVDLGIAVDTPRGLIVPILRDLAELPLDTVASRAATAVERARQGELSLDDTAGGVITISNVGMHNVTYLTPIISPGQTAILGVGSVREVFRPGSDGSPELRRELGVVLACDHRVLDGVCAAAFLNRIVGHLERPLRLLRAPGGR
jgi:pyruvate dehydrogenase E2 component (dihydrolipoamide acetyltransferase)